VSVHGDGGPLEPQLAVEVDPNRRKLFAYDGQGAVPWQLDWPTAQNEDNMFWFHNYFMNDGRYSGHVLLLWMGRRVVAIDQLADGGQGKILWSRDTLRVDPNNWYLVPILRARMQMQALGQAALAGAPQPLVVTPGYAAFQQDRLLVAVEPVSGETLWLRDDLPRGCDLQGDAQVLLATPPDGDEAIVLDAIDGRERGRCQRPPLSQRVMTLGRSLVTWATAGETCDLKRVDPWEQKTVWARQFPAKAKYWPLAASEICVLNPDGKFVVLSVEDGRPILDTTVDATQDLESIFVLRNDRRYVLLANEPESQKDDPFQWNRPQPGYVRAHGKVYGLDARSGQRQWVAEVRQQWCKGNHPADAPLLSFFRRHQKAVQVGNNAWRHEQPTVTVRCLDSRTGRTIHDSKIENAFEQSYQLTVDPRANRIELQTRLETAAFTYRAPPPEKK
jgi:hypothetical protein